MIEYGWKIKNRKIKIENQITFNELQNIYIPILKGEEIQILNKRLTNLETHKSSITQEAEIIIEIKEYDQNTDIKEIKCIRGNEGEVPFDVLPSIHKQLLTLNNCYNQIEFLERIQRDEKLAEIYSKTNMNIDLTAEELTFLYELDGPINGIMPSNHDKRTDKIIAKRNKINDLKKIFSSKRIINGDINLDKIKQLYDVTFPEISNGKISITNSGSLYNVKFPKEINGGLFIDAISLTNVDLPQRINNNSDLQYQSYLNIKGVKNLYGIKLPENVEHLRLEDLEDTDNLEIPKSVKILALNSVQKTLGLIIPDSVDYLYLDGLIDARNIKLPDSMEELSIDSLESSKGLELPTVMLNTLNANKLKNANGLKFPSNMKNISLNSLVEAKDLVFPGNLERLHLYKLETITGITLPKEVKYSLFLNKLKSAKGLVIPKGNPYIYLNSLQSLDGLYFPAGTNLNKVVMPKHLKEKILLNPTEYMEDPISIKSFFRR